MLRFFKYSTDVFALVAVLWIGTMFFLQYAEGKGVEQRALERQVRELTYEINSVKEAMEATDDERK